MKIRNLSGWCGFAVSAIVLCVALGVVAGSPTAEAGNKANKLMSKHAQHAVACAACHGKGKKVTTIQTAKCLECHGDGKALAERTAKAKPRNPHDNRHYGTEADCSLCHREHTASENFCLPCHDRILFKVP